MLATLAQRSDAKELSNKAVALINAGAQQTSKRKSSQFASAELHAQIQVATQLDEVRYQALRSET